MRKAFNFYRSYYDILDELSDKEKLVFLNALFKKQFFNIEPDLKGMPRFAYLSQKHSIDKQVIGYERALNVDLSESAPPLGLPPILTDKEEEVQGKEEEQEKEQWFIDWFNNSMEPLKGRKGKYKLIKIVKSQLHARIKEGYTSEDFKNAFKAIKENDYHKEKSYQYLTPEFITRSSILEKWSNIEEKENKKYNPTSGDGIIRLSTKW